MPVWEGELTVATANLNPAAFWNPRRVSTGYPTDSGARRHLPVTRLIVTYVLLLPLAIFAVHGGFSFQHASWNTDLGAVGGKMAVPSSSAETLRGQVQSWATLGVCLAAMFPHFRRIAGIAWRMPLMLALPLYAISSALWSQDAALSLRSGVALLICTLFAFYLAGCFSGRQQMELMVLTGSFVAVSSVVLALFWPQFGVDHQLHEGAWQGLFTQKNTCAEVMLFMLTPALALPCRSRYGQILRAIYIVLCLLLIFMSQSRTAWAMTLLYLCFTASLRALGRFERKDLLPLATLLFAAAAAIIVAAMDYSTVVLSLLSRSEGLSGRGEIWDAIVAAILRHPLGGYGFDAFWSLLYGEASRVFAATGWVVTGAHNGFLNVGLELGLVGIAMIAATFLTAFRHMSASFRPGRARYVDWCIGLVFLTLAYNFDERTFMATQYLPWMLYIVACVGLQQAARASGQVPKKFRATAESP
jgi:exopolysaccharide production protein ExoQ